MNDTAAVAAAEDITGTPALVILTQLYYSSVSGTQHQRAIDGQYGRNKIPRRFFTAVL